MPRESELGRVVEALKRAGVRGMTFAELKEATKLSAACIRGHLAELLKSDFYRTEAIRSKKRGRPQLLYIHRDSR